MQKIYVAGELICPEKGTLVGYFSVRENFPTMSVLVLDIAWQGLLFSLIVTLFLVGTTISIKDIKNTGSKPLWLGIVLWLFISVFSFFYIVYWS